MNKARFLGILISFIGLILMYKIEGTKNGWIVNALVGAITGVGFILIVFGKFNFKKRT